MMDIVFSKVRPLDNRKHYGTEIEISTPKGTTLITVWLPFGGPSEEELRIRWDITREDWKNNVLVDDVWGGMSPVQREYPCDSHFQSQFEADVATLIATALNGMAWKDYD